jgi:hypothetical protein
MHRTSSFILLAFAQFIVLRLISAQCPYLACYPSHKQRVWKVEDLRVRSFTNQSNSYASFTLYRSRWHGDYYYTVPTPNTCMDESESDYGPPKEKWNVCPQVQLAPDGEWLPNELRRWLKWRATEIDDQPHPQNSSRRVFNYAKIEVAQGLPWPVYVLITLTARFSFTDWTPAACIGIIITLARLLETRSAL